MRIGHTLNRNGLKKQADTIAGTGQHFDLELSVSG
jgi:hypothetical protein